MTNLAELKAQRDRTLADRLEAAPKAYLLCFAVMFLLARCCSNLKQPFWFDELITYYLAGVPSVGQIWHLIGKGIELNPPLLFWLTWILRRVLGEGEVITRLPATVGYLLLCLCLFQYVRRRSDARHGFIALMLPVFAYTSRDATFARGYGLMLGASAAALLCWQMAKDGVRRTWVIPGLALAIATAVSCHYYACFVVLALLAGEGLRTVRRNCIDWPVVLSIIAGVSPVVAYGSLMKFLPMASKTFWIAPSMDDLYSSYSDLLGPISMALFLFIVSCLQMRTVPNAEVAPPVLPQDEQLVVSLLLALPLVIFVAAKISPLAFYTRYVQMVVIGFAIALPLFAYRMAGRNRNFVNKALAVLVYLCFLPWAAFHIATAFTGQSPASATRSVLQVPEGDAPVVVDNDDDYLRLFHYSEPTVRLRLFYPMNFAASVRYLGSDTPQRSLAVLERFQDVHAVDYGAFLKTHPHFLLFEYQTGWMVQKLLADGATLRLIREDKPHGYFVRHVALFEVTLQGPITLHDRTDK